jgi:hypothetical protein
MHAQTRNGVEFAVRDLELATFGRHQIRLAEHEMPGLMALRREFADQRPLRGARIAGSLHMTMHTAVLVDPPRSRRVPSGSWGRPERERSRTWAGSEVLFKSREELPVKAGARSKSNARGKCQPTLST